MQPRFNQLSDRDGIEIVDPIENARFALYTDRTVEPATTDPETFYFPVDTAITVTTSAIEVPKLGNITVRQPDGAFVADNADCEDRTLPVDTYLIELGSAPMKLYLTVESALTIEHTDSSTVVSFDSTVSVHIGARSFHDNPAGTITVTNDIEDVMRAISLFGSALKTTSPERSFPTLRGHPPLIELGDEFHAPEGLERPETGIQLRIPPEPKYVYPATPLAYYLGAEVRPGSSPQLRIDGFEYPLTGDYETTIHRLFRQVFFFDCLTRTEGYYPVDLHERAEFEAKTELTFDFETLYDQPLATRLKTYLTVPFEEISDLVPDWNLTTDIAPVTDHADVLPFVAKDLALVRCPPKPSEQSVTPEPEATTDFLRSPPEDAFVRGASDYEPAHDIFNLTPSDTIEHAWVGDGYPLGVNKLSVTSQRRRIEQQRPEKSEIEIHVVCNDEGMQEEGVVADHYGLRDLLQFDVNLHYDVTVEELRDLLETPGDFLHYIGHVNDEGMRCSDGYLDARELSNVQMRAFLLNACRSYEQGEALVEAGSLGGVVTLTEIANVIATQLGKPLARFLNCGFPLRVALSIVQDHVLTGSQYITVGDGGLTLVQSESGVVAYPQIEKQNHDLFSIVVRTYPIADHGIGTIGSTNFTSTSAHFVVPSTSNNYTVSREDLTQFFDLEITPFEYQGELHWSDEFDREYL